MARSREEIDESNFKHPLGPVRPIDKTPHSVNRYSSIDSQRILESHVNTSNKSD